MIIFLKKAETFLEILASTENESVEIAHSLNLKLEHTRQVAKICGQLARANHCTPNDQIFAELLGLCHDLGRFPQFRKYGTFDDTKSINHAYYSVKMVALLPFFSLLTPRDRGLLMASVWLHNYKDLPPSLPPRLHFFASLLRDADRLDIFRIFNNYYKEGPLPNSPLELSYPDTGKITPAVPEALLQGISPPYQLGHSVQDMRLIKLSWAYNFSTPGAVALFFETGIWESTQQVLPDTPDLQQLLSKMKMYIQKKL